MCPFLSISTVPTLIIAKIKLNIESCHSLWNTLQLLLIAFGIKSKTCGCPCVIHFQSAYPTSFCGLPLLSHYILFIPDFFSVILIHSAGYIFFLCSFCSSLLSATCSLPQEAPFYRLHQWSLPLGSLGRLTGCLSRRSEGGVISSLAHLAGSIL